MAGPPDAWNLAALLGSNPSSPAIKPVRSRRPSQSVAAMPTVSGSPADGCEESVPSLNEVLT